MQKRGCTDVICLLIFLAYVGGMVAVFVMAVAAYGDPYRLFYGYDVKGDTCGRNNDQLDIYPLSGEDLSEKKYLHFNVARTGILFLPDDYDEEFGKLGIERYDGDDKIGYCLDTLGNASSINANPTPNPVENPTTEVSEVDETVTNANILGFGDPINTLLTGGDSCRECLKECPKNQ